MFKTSEILYAILIIAILVLLLSFYKDRLINNKYIATLSMYMSNAFGAKNVVEKKEEMNKQSSENLFATEYEVSADANNAISDALKQIDDN